MKLKKIYVSFNVASKKEEEELNKLSFLFNELDMNKILEQKLNKNVDYATTLEIYLLICTLRNKGYDDIELLINPSLFIFNEDLYKISNNSIIKMKTENVGFFSVRGYNWDHPFFYLLKDIINRKGGILTKTNYQKSVFTDNGKFRSIGALYKKRNFFLGDIIIPHDIKSYEYNLFKDFVKENIGQKVVIKRNFGEYGKEVYMLDLKDYTEFQEKKLTDNLDSHLLKTKEIYITAYKKFKNEYRVYFTNFNKKPKIYSIKMKHLKWDEKEIFNEYNFYYKGKFTWSDMTNKQMKNDGKYIVNISKKYVKNLDYTAGVLEFGEISDGSLMLFEVNHMGASLFTTKEDSDNMGKYYKEIFSNYLK
ncbi:hypothetical protein EOM39_02735 [Candidatus Gracilibacteria bacterium]|nr:hypothetical protein [Candidatus Gracilibacteria bacterium]